MISKTAEKIALVYDNVNKWGGGERVLLALHELYPDAPLFTSVYDSNKAPWARVFPKIIPSFLNTFPILRTHHEIVPFLMPLAFETLDLSGFDAVISVTSANAKGIITQPDTFHLCYCLTPTRYLYSHRDEYASQLNPFLRLLSQPAFSYLHYWDSRAAKRPDAYIAISDTVRNRLKTYYNVDSPVVYPPVNLFSEQLKQQLPEGIPEKYFLYVGRFVPYKKPDVVIEAFNYTRQNLVVVGSGALNWGSGAYTDKLRNLAGPSIFFTGNVTDAHLAALYANCQAVIFFHEEDFGIVPVEAMSAGKPVIGVNIGGVSETVASGITGLLADRSDTLSLVGCLEKFSGQKFNSQRIRNHARKFSHERFLTEFGKVFNTQWQKYRTTYSY